VLIEMRLRGLGVIRDAALEFGPGLTVVTGETGAGKTMVVTGLSLLLGGRADAGAVREGQGSAVVEGRVQLDPQGSVARRAQEAGAELDDDVLILSRTVSAEGRGRAHVGGRSAPVSLLAELGAELVTVHGQTDQIRLKSTARQRDALDRFAAEAVLKPLATFKQCWRELHRVEAELREITDRARERAQEAELLRLGVAEVERIAPQPGEDVALRAEADRLSHAEELRTAALLAQAALSGGDGNDGSDATLLVSGAKRALDGVRHHDQRLSVLADRLAEVGYLVNDIAAECASYADAVESDPVRLAGVEERRAVLAGLTRAHGGDVDQVLAWASRSSDRLLELDGDDDRIDQLAGERERLRVRAGELAGEVSRARSVAAAKLGTSVSAELQGLSMPDARLIVAVRQRPDDTGLVASVTDPEAPAGKRATSKPGRWAAGPDGIDDVEFLLAPHPGASPRPLAKGASGGELSRVMLGLEVVLGAADPVPTFVFDEVDAGVGGRAALGIGRRLSRLGRNSQVLVVTHLAQVAAFADRHLVVVKSREGDVTESGVRLLDDQERVRELARMLGGIDDSETAQAHAEELLETARSESGVLPI
jgi:DNA repair protein RecN (Recombination protein N)